ncbi:hypothetical protein TWF694_008265 [Orbilia ellipsospora]|uniref:Uncharacterized protein n=1 Tax=Orbilia ellipsospora TaxID=2528407 RepID=A0AAV9XGY1_9PEZI
MANDLAFLLPMAFIIILVVILFCYLCTRNSRPKNIFAFDGAKAWEDFRFFFTGPAQKTEVVEIRDEESGLPRPKRGTKKGTKKGTKEGTKKVVVEEDTG